MFVETTRMQQNPLARAGEYAFDGTTYIPEEDDVILRSMDPAPPTDIETQQPTRDGMALIRRLLLCSILCHCVNALLLCAAFIGAASLNVVDLVHNVTMATETLPVIIEHMTILEHQIGNATDIGAKLLKLASTFGFL